MKTIVEELRESAVPEQNLIFLDLDSRAYKIKTPEQLEKELDMANGEIFGREDA